MSNPNRHWTMQHPSDCNEPNCDREYHARGFCHSHYIRARRRGQLPKLTLEDLFVESFDITDDGCWPWVGNRDKKGYGIMPIGAGRKTKAHRWIWSEYVSPIPEGLQVHHLCRNTSCVNPDHLEPITGLDNQRRRWNVTHKCKDCGSRNIESVFGDLDLTIT